MPENKKGRYIKPRHSSTVKPSDSILSNLRKEFHKYIDDRKSNMEKKWSGDKEFPGRASMFVRYKRTNNSMQAIMTFSGQKMWTMEFGRGHNDKTGEGVHLGFLKTRMFKEYSSSPVFSEGRTLASNERYKKAQYRKAVLKARKKRALAQQNLSDKAKKNIKSMYSTQGGQHVYKGEFGNDRTGGKAYNIVRIFTRSGNYSDIDNPSKVHRGSGLGGKYGLNTEAFTFHKGGRYEDTSLAHDMNYVIAEPNKGFPIADFAKLGEKAIWKFKKDDSLYNALTDGLTKDITSLIEDAIKNR